VILTIVIPALDEAGNLARLLPDLAGECPGAEIIVVDGGSRDGSPAAAARRPGVRVLASPRGRAGQMNHGARAASGDTLLFLHADTRLPADAAAAIERALAEPGVVGGRFDVRFDSSRRVLAVVAWFMNARSRLSSICTGDQAIFVRRADFEAVGGYPEIPLMEDIELSRRLKRRGRLRALGLRVTTSARKWEREGPLRTIALMWALRFLHFCGVSPARLHRWYYGAPKERPMSDGKDEQVVETATGLGYVDLVEGTGARPKQGDTVSVHYTGWLKSGAKFDSSVDRGAPFEFPIGRGRVIKGWDEGVMSMKIGGKRKLIIPAHLGYGDRGAGGVIPPGATLIFEVELLGIR
jgi:rSAM/selenodomain-associated transferase 2